MTFRQIQAADDLRRIRDWGICDSARAYQYRGEINMSCSDDDHDDAITNAFKEDPTDQIEAQFSHDTKFDYINLDFHVERQIREATECPHEGCMSYAEHQQTECSEFAVYMTSAHCPFIDFVRFLEAITTKVQECSFTWNAEGPSGRMTWEQHFEDTGALFISWDSMPNEVGQRVRLGNAQAVKALYSAFRAFADSSDYHPLRYERLTVGEAFAMVLADASTHELADVLVKLNARDSEGMIQRLRDVVSLRSSGGVKQTYPLSYFFQSADFEEPSGTQNQWIPPEWESWSLEQRAQELRDVFGWSNGHWFGTNLRKLRSRTIEEWLASRDSRSD